MNIFMLVVILSLIGLAIFYFAFFRGWQLRWGATDEEIKRALPGDDIVSRPTFNATRAVSIEAQAEHIFPWIVQIGARRAGWYSYDLLDNLGKPSAKEILPEHQNIQVGNLVPMSPDGKQGLWVKDFNHPGWILWWDKAGDTSWAWCIFPQENGRSRLVTRVRVRYRWLSLTILFNLIIEFGDIWMMRKCMLGIKKRAEQLAVARA